MHDRARHLGGRGAIPVRLRSALALAAGSVFVIAGCTAQSRPAAQVTTTITTTVAASVPPAVPTTASPATSGPSRPAAATGPALAGLATLSVKGRAPMTGYARSEFGQAWTDDNDEPYGHNGCDTRNDILRRDLHVAVVKAGTFGCVASSGLLDDPYTSRPITFVRGAATSSRVQIDHVVSLGDAWQSGAQQLTARQRQNLANDPLNLLVVDGSANQQKSASNAASWLPANRAFRCRYVARQVAVKIKWSLWMTAAERDAIARVLATCPDEQLPTEPGALGPVPVHAIPPTTTAVPADPTDPYYSSCSAVRAAGKAPLRVGQPGYRPGLDGDGDGVACE
jgi:hypothetical protein